MYVPAIFVDASTTATLFNAPFDLWFQATGRLWLGPMSGFVFHSETIDGRDVPLGFGLGYQILRTLDLKTQLLFPAITDDYGLQSFGFGVGIQVRIE